MFLYIAPLSLNFQGYRCYRSVAITLFRRLEAERRKERTEAHLYMIVQVLMEDEFCSHQGNDLFNSDKCHYRSVDAVSWPLTTVRLSLCHISLSL